MRNELLQELARVSRDVQWKRDTLAAPYTDRQEEMFFDLIQKIMGLRQIMRGPYGKDGVDRAVDRIRQENQPEYRFLPLLYDIAKDADFHAPTAEDIATVTYFAYSSTFNVDSYDALRFLICQEGLLSLFKREKPEIMERRMLALLSEPLSSAYRDYVKSLQNK